MTNVKFKRKEFESLLGKKVTKDIEDKISLFGTPLESISEEEIEIEIFPNRPDLISLQGFIRGFKAFLGKETGLRKYPIKKPEKNYKVIIENSVKSIRPYTACAIVKNLSLDDEKIKNIIDLQEKLHNTLGRNRKKVAIGIYPLEKIKLPITYEARKPEDILFTPLESSKEMSGRQILQKHPTGKEHAYLLEDYDKYPVFIDADKKILSMPPIINSHETGKVTEETKSVFVECSGWHLETLEKTLNIVVTTLAEMEGSIYSMELNYKSKKIITPDMSPKKSKISLEKVNKILGLKLKETDLQKLLPKMGYEYSKGAVKIPAWRTDILHEIDIIEDIAISYGYNNFEPSLPKIATEGEESKESKIKRKISETLLGLGLLEISTYHLIKKEEEKIMKIQDPIEVKDSKTEYKSLRKDLLTPALRILTENKDHEYPQRFFEIGTVFSLDKDSETKIKETEKLSITLSPGNFTEAKQTIGYLLKMLSLRYEISETTAQNTINGRTAEIRINDKPVGYIGELSPETLRNWNIKMPASYIEISLEEIF